MIGPGVVGSYVDIATLLVVLVHSLRVQSSQGDGHAVAVAIAKRVDGVAEDRVRADLEVEPRESAQYLVDGGES